MDQHHLGIVGHRSQPGSHRCGTGGATGHHGRHSLNASHQCLGGSQSLGSDYHDNAVGGPSRRGHAVGHHRSPTQGGSLLVATKTFTMASSHHDRPDTHRVDPRWRT